VGVVSGRSKLAICVDVNSSGAGRLGAFGGAGIAKSNGRGASGFSTVLGRSVVGEDMR
jgi:hypothetical protein